MRTGPETYLGIPVGMIRAHLDILDQLSRCVTERMRLQREGDWFMPAVLNRAQLVLQGRLEGVHLAWYMMNAESPDSDDRFREIAQLWSERQST